MFTQKLMLVLESFEIEKALALSNEIHKAESEGYNIGKYEDSLWLRLTTEIEKQNNLTKKQN